MRSTLLSSVVFIACMAASPLFASAAFLDRVSGHETGSMNDPYNQMNLTGSSAHGKYQIIVGNYANMGYVERKPGGGKGWDGYQFTSKAKSLGVSSLSDLGSTSAGRNLQDRVASDLAQEMWSGLKNGGATSVIGKTVNGVKISEAGLLGSTWFLGPGDMNTWAKGGLTVDALRNHPNLSKIMKANPAYGTVEELHSYLINRMGDYGNIDISEITNGEFTPGGGEYETETYLACAADTEEMMVAEDEAYVEAMVAAAQDEALGYSQLQESFGELSCLDFAFSGGMDILFTTPSLSDIGSQAMDMACEKVQTLTGDVTGKIQGAMGEAAGALSGGGANFGPLGNYFGVQAQSNNTGDFSVGTTGGQGGGINVGGNIGGGSALGTTFADINREIQGNTPLGQLFVKVAEKALQ